MTAEQIALIIGAMFTGFGTLIAAAFKGYALVNRVGKTQDRNDALIEAKILKSHEDIVSRLSNIDHEIQTIKAKVVWAEGAPEKTKKVMASALDEMRKISQEQKDWLHNKWGPIPNKEKKE